MSLAGLTLGAAIALFHGQLLWQRLAEGSLLQPAVFARWSLSLLLVAALARLWLRGLSLLRGRRAGVLWLIVVLLHALPAAGPVAAIESGAEGLLPAVLAALAFVAGLTVGSRRRGSVAALDRRPCRPRRSGGRLRRGWSRALFCRPPPVALQP